MESTIAIVFSTWHGHAEKVARRIADVAYMRGIKTRVIDVAQDVADEADLERFDAIVIVGSVHFGRHPRPLIGFVRRKLQVLSWIPNAFVSISGAAASIQGDSEARRYMHEFTAQTGWQPDMTLSVAGAVPYSKYNAVTRLMMKFASRIAGRDSDTSRDYEYTNWFNVEDFAREFLAELGLDRRRETG